MTRWGWTTCPTSLRLSRTRPEEERDDEKGLRGDEPGTGEVVRVETEEDDGRRDAAAPAEEAEQDDDPDEDVDPVRAEKRAAVVPRQQPEDAQRDEGPEDELEEQPDEPRHLGLQDEPVLEDERPDGEEGEEPERDGDGPVERRSQPVPRLRPRQVPHVELRQRSEEPPFGHRRESTVAGPSNV